MPANSATTPETVSRRRRPVRAFAVALLTVIVAGSTACGGDGSASEDASGSSESAAWSFEDDKGVTHTLDSVPDVIAAQSVSAGGLWEYGVVADGVFGPLRRSDGTTDPALGLADPDDFESLGEVDSQINLEALAALHPDIIVTAMWSDTQYWGIDDAQIDTIEQIAPVVGIRVDNRSIVDVLARYAELAESLGGDKSKIESAKAEFDAGSQKLKDALASKPGLSVVAASGVPAEMYIAYPPAFPELRYYGSLGMDLAEPEDHPTSGGFWETISWEQAGKYPADVLLGDARGGTVEQILGLLPATAKALPAVQAGQLYSWPTVQAYGYGAVAVNTDRLATEIGSSRSDLV